MVCLVIPALNEADVIGDVVRSVPRSVVNQIIVVDNGSTDATAKSAKDAVVVSQPTRGYGRACRAGVNAAVEAGANIVAFIDGDGSDCPEFMNELIRPIQENRFDFRARARLIREAEQGFDFDGSRHRIKDLRPRTNQGGSKAWWIVSR
jgi:glycosyltransferase involved in cell wall biosynthesis